MVNMVIYFFFIWWYFEHPNNKNKKDSISNLIKSLIKIYITYCQKLDFEAFA
jgi:hypothetical protein